MYTIIDRPVMCCKIIFILCIYIVVDIYILYMNEWCRV